ARLAAWDELALLLGDVDFLADAWERSDWDVRNFWTETEAHSENRLVDCYRAVIERLEDGRGSSQLAELLMATGHGQDALPLLDRRIRASRQSRDLGGFLDAASRKAAICQLLGDLDEANAIFRECESLAKRSGLAVQAAEMMGHRAGILWTRGEYAGALDLS